VIDTKPDENLTTKWRILTYTQYKCSVFWDRT